MLAGSRGYSSISPCSIGVARRLPRLIGLVAACSSGQVNGSYVSKTAFGMPLTRSCNLRPPMNRPPNANYDEFPSPESPGWREIARNPRTCTSVFDLANHGPQFLCKQIATTDEGGHLIAQMEWLDRLHSEPIDGLVGFVSRGSLDRIELLRPYLPGTSLASELQKPCDLRTLLDLGIHLTGIVSALHRRGVFHGNIKPSNIIMGDSVCLHLSMVHLIFPRSIVRWSVRSKSVTLHTYHLNN